MTAGVHIAEHEAAQGLVGHITLDVPKTLNSLTLDMVNSISDALEQWASRDDIAAVLIDGAGEKAFCAGGDVQALRNSSLENPGGPCVYAETFFAREYRMNYLMHTYAKPILCWGHGVVMGGGLGILAACSHRVVSERTRIGMPEITIALFPDVGGSWFLNRMPGHAGRFLALTAVTINATDALYCGLGNTYLGADQHDAVVAALLDAEWPTDNAARHTLLSTLLAQLTPSTDAPAAQLEPAMGTVNAWMDGDELAVIVERVLAYDGEDAWLLKARDGLAHGSKLAAAWIFRQLNETRGATLEQVFASELRLGANIMRYPEFAEGVRALLIDKDRQPKWQFASVADVPEDLLDRFFQEAEGTPDLNLPE